MKTINVRILDLAGSLSIGARFVIIVGLIGLTTVALDLIAWLWLSILAVLGLIAVATVVHLSIVRDVYLEGYKDARAGMFFNSVGKGRQ